ncbi:CYTH domain-containing protein [Salipaludibacillus agaradhaerens]|uniref:CYTH domain-containing protein n=1 Tax=Salipaludibacillus agaradhaerens TaxID=76935 RepID=A0A9Q4FYJ1_SALAG|nr:CYTH domain-containing protein [Salipaludibacillus agaradhaerens]MCR6095794.1 CYTH domain-containing protein [Salipaludibacillus agaradhaerens]MCR6114646.1 CYTH domain-containing protein [Salipaludibacillus agaradhaerens]
MTQEIEIEFKQLIDKNTYEAMLTYFQNKRHPIITQINHYFETKNFLLKDKKSALRVRYKEGDYILTLKQPHSSSLLETHQHLDEKSFKDFKNSGCLPEGAVKKQLSTLLNLQTVHFTYLGYLTTERSEVPIKEGLLVLDKSSYFNTTDYELEFECGDYDSGKLFFLNFLEKWQMSWNKPKNKIERFYEASPL